MRAVPGMVASAPARNLSELWRARASTPLPASWENLHGIGCAAARAGFVSGCLSAGGAGQDTRGRTPANVESGGTGTVGIDKSTKAESLIPTEVETGVATGKTERMRRLSVDLPESWHRRFKVACTRADK